MFRVAWLQFFAVGFIVPSDCYAENPLSHPPLSVSKNVIVIDNEGKYYAAGPNDSFNYGETGRSYLSDPYEGTFKTKYASTGNSNSCFVLEDNKLKCYGTNYYGETSGDGINGQISAPDGKIIKFEKENGSFSYDTKFVSKIREFTCAILLDDSLWCFGHNHYYQCGVGHDSEKVKATQILEDVEAVAITHQNGCAIKKDKTLWCWGRNKDGEAGVGNKKTVKIPQKIADNVIKISAGTFHFCALFSNTDLKCWGYSSNAADTISPTLVGTGVKDVAAGRDYSCFTLIADDGDSLLCMGSNDEADLFPWTNDKFLIDPVIIPYFQGDVAKIKYLDAGWGGVCAMLVDANIKCWGQFFIVDNMNFDNKPNYEPHVFSDKTDSGSQELSIPEYKLEMTNVDFTTVGSNLFSTDGSNLGLNVVYTVSDVDSQENVRTTLFKPDCVKGTEYDDKYDNPQAITFGIPVFDDPNFTVEILLETKFIAGSDLTVLDPNSGNSKGTVSFCLQAELMTNDNAPISASFQKTNIDLSFDLTTNDFEVKNNKIEENDIIETTKEIDTKYSILASRCMEDGAEYTGTAPILEQNQLIHICLQPNATDVKISSFTMKFWQDTKVIFTAVTRVGTTTQGTALSAISGSGTQSSPYRVTSRLVTALFENGNTFDVKGDAYMEFTTSRRNKIRRLETRQEDRFLQDGSDAGQAPFGMEVFLSQQNMIYKSSAPALVSMVVIGGGFVLLITVLFKKLSK
eukprot:CAMPEP_0194274386 /NCGR_PEP_ID=MMETSP0169-20130528/7473_1 /TAXON_ID=218684 /ORGANISM="Corethron pennatum, Strain L29A3" /LENGTH=741 /DNA_ID=CAMNT_0039017555 /DNA_START=77 /DNA_END=2302 /DNA_ORIENTATION=-